jgi:DNA-binding SARP family transcriptional activator/ABC-type branched-subunit amino acid transport system substrate-binding protein/DNA-binding beta-propeller fold protein YncE
MQFGILGPLEVSDEGRRVEIGGHKQRALLASLLLHANEVVSLDRLIDELWGETPPPTAAKTLQAQVSRLRRALNGDVDPATHMLGPLETRGHGYLLKVEPGQIDADRFQGMLEEARRTRAEGKPEKAAEELRRALALWRGPALADFAYEPFAQTEIVRLDELQLTAFEERLEADLALGRHTELIGELEALVARHPLRERLRGQLMLALYCSDRQAEALHVYQEFRLALAEELGLEPSQGLQRLERQILEQDPELAGPARRLGPRPARSRVRMLALAGALLLAAAVAAVVVLVLRDGGSETVNGREETIAGGSAGALDPRTGDLLATIPLGTSPTSIAVGEGSVWVLDADDRTVSQIDPRKRKLVRTFSTGSTPTDLAVGAGAIWIGNGVRQVRTALPESVSRFDPESAVVDETIPLHPAIDVVLYTVGHDSLRPHIAVTDAAIWVVNPDLRISRIDPRTNRVVTDVAGVRALSLAAGEGEVWIVNDEGEVVEIDSRTNAASKPISVGAESLTALAVGAGAVWAADPVDGIVWRIDPDPDRPIQHTISLKVGVGGVAFGEGAVWATNELTDEVYRIDPDTNEAQVVSRMPAPRGVAVGEGAVWVTSAGPPSAEEALPASSCDKLFYGGAGSARFVVASDLPLQGPDRAGTLPMTEAIRFVLEQRDFRAGQYTVGYQSCDDSTAQAGGYDLYKCFSNAKAYARDLAVLGVVGPLNSPCAGVQIPITNQAPGGGLAMISPSNTWADLTRPDPGEHENGFYPSGERNFVRIAAADHLQAVADATLVKELDLQSVFVLSDDSDFGPDVETAARNLGLEIVGSSGWNSEARDFDRLAGRVARTRADAVFIGGGFYPNGGALVRDLGARLGPDVALVASDRFSPVPDLLEAAGPAARGMYLSLSGMPNRELPPPGKRFLEEFEATRAGEPSPSNSAAYAAQATEILLDAIARSDGTRESVTRELLETTIEDGILGDIDFDENGDPVEAPVTIFRVVGKGRADLLPGFESFESAVVDRVITARADLLR